MAKKTRTELSTLAINTNLPDNTTELITPTTERSQLTDERESVVNYKDDLGGVSNAGKFITVATDGESLTMVDEPTGELSGTGSAARIAFWSAAKVLTYDDYLSWNTSTDTLNAFIVNATNKLIAAIINSPEGNSITLSTQPTGGTLTPRLTISSGGNVGIGGTLAADSQFRVELKPAATILAGLRIGYNNTSKNYYDADEHFFRNGIGTNNHLTISSVGLATFTPSGEYAALFENTNTAGGQHCYVDIKSNGGSNGRAYLRFMTDVAESGGTSAIVGYQDDLFFQTGVGDAYSTRLTISSVGMLEKNGNSSTARIIPATDNVGYLGDSTHRWQAVFAVNGSIQTSDRNEKTLITTSDLGLDFILKLEPVSYKWKVGGWDIEENGKDEEPTKTPIDGKRNHYGLIAQQVKEVIGDKDFGGWVKEDLEDDASMESLRYAEFISPMIKAIQEQQTIIDNLITRLEALEV